MDNPIIQQILMHHRPHSALLNLHQIMFQDRVQLDFKPNQPHDHVDQELQEVGVVQVLEDDQQLGYDQWLFEVGLGLSDHADHVLHLLGVRPGRGLELAHKLKQVLVFSQPINQIIQVTVDQLLPLI